MSHFRGRLTIVTLVAVMSMLLTACGGPQQAANTPTPSPVPSDTPAPPTAVPPTPTPGIGVSVYTPVVPAAADLAATTSQGVAVFGDSQTPGTLNPLFASAVVEVEIMAGLWDGLVGVDNKMGFYPDLAASVPTVQNGGVSLNKGGTCKSKADELSCPLVTTFTLRSGLMWSDGQPLTSADVVYGWKTLMDPATGPASTSGPDQIVNIEAPDAQTAVIYWIGQGTSKTDPYGPWLASLPPVLPKHSMGLIADKNIAKDPSSTKPRVTSGAYYVTDYVSDQHVTLTQNPYYKAWNGHKAYFPTVKFVTYGTIEAEVAAVQKGGSEAPNVTEDYTVDNIKSLQAAPGINVNIAPALSWEHMDFNMAKPLFKNHPELRKAIAESVDKASILLNIIHVPAAQVQSSIANSPEPPLAWDYDPTVKAPAYDPAAAKAQLAAAGWKANASGVLVAPDGTVCNINFQTTTKPVRKQNAALFTTEMKNLGCKVTVSYVQSSVFFDTTWADNGPLEHGLYDMSEFAYVDGVDPDGNSSSYMSTYIPSATNSGGNYQRLNDPALDAALLGGRSSVDFAVRAGFYHTYQHIIIDNNYLIPLYYNQNVSSSSKFLGNYALNPTSATNEWNMVEWFHSASM